MQAWTSDRPDECSSCIQIGGQECFVTSVERP